MSGHWFKSLKDCLAVTASFAANELLRKILSRFHRCSIGDDQPGQDDDTAGRNPAIYRYRYLRE